MEIEKELMSEHSKTVTERVVAYIGDSPTRFAELMQLFFGADYRLVQRAAWPMSYAVQKHPSLFAPYFEPALLFMRQKGLPDAVVRNTLRILQDLDVPEHLQGELVDMCLEYIVSPVSAAAIKAFAISTLENLCKKYPELAEEVKIVLLERMEYEKPAFVSRAKRFLKVHK